MVHHNVQPVDRKAYVTVMVAATMLNTYFIEEVLQLLNQLCPGCLTLKQKGDTKKADGTTIKATCKYCSVTHESNIKAPRETLTQDFWDFEPDNHPPQSFVPKKILSAYQGLSIASKGNSGLLDIHRLSALAGCGRLPVCKWTVPWAKQLRFKAAKDLRPAHSFINAAKQDSVDNLSGTLDATALGKEPCIGTSGHFKILYSGKSRETKQNENIYEFVHNPEVRAFKTIVLDTYSQTTERSYKQRSTLNSQGNAPINGGTISINQKILGAKIGVNPGQPNPNSRCFHCTKEWRYYCRLLLQQVCLWCCKCYLT
uniref:Uncharacterized protein n=1 Tax=Leersia perrieri TaxID=77586 RepID=A0A0D9XGK2_9ORYZ